MIILFEKSEISQNEIEVLTGKMNPIILILKEKLFLENHYSATSLDSPMRMAVNSILVSKR